MNGFLSFASATFQNILTGLCCFICLKGHFTSSVVSSFMSYYIYILYMKEMCISSWSSQADEANNHAALIASRPCRCSLPSAC